MSIVCCMCDYCPPINLHNFIYSQCYKLTGEKTSKILTAKSPQLQNLSKKYFQISLVGKILKLALALTDCTDLSLHLQRKGISQHWF